MKIYKVCHYVCIKHGNGDKVLTPDFGYDVRVFTSKRRAVNDAARSVCCYRDVLGYKVSDVDDDNIGNWVLETDTLRRVIQVIEDETK